MAEREEIIRIKLDSEQFKSQMIAREKEINNTKEAIKLLNYEIAKEGKATEKQLKQKVELEATQRNLNKEQQNAKRILDNHIKSQEAATGSIVAYRAELAVLTNAYNNLSQEERENTDAGKNLQKEIKGISDKLKEQEGAIGDNRRSVGSYTEAINQAITGNAAFGDGVQKISEAYQIITQVGGQYLQTIKDDIAAMGGKTVATNTATEAMTAQTAATNLSSLGMKGAQKSAVALSIGLKALGIGLVITAIAGLLSYFSRFEEGTERLEQAFSGIGAAVSVLIGRFGEFGRAIVEAVSSPLESIKKLNEAFVNAVKDPIQAIKDLKGAFDGMVESNRQLAGEMGRAARAAASITKATQELEDAQLATLPTNEKIRGQIDQLILQARERTKSEQDRINGLKQAGILEQQLTAQRLDFARKELELALRTEQLQRATGQLDRGTRSQEAIDAELKLQQIQNESAMQRQQIRNRESGLIQEIQKDREEREKAAQERITNSLRAAIELRIIQAGEGTRKEMEERIKLIEFERDQELKQENLTQNEKKLIRAKSEQERLKLAKEFTDAILAEQEKQATEFVARTNKEFQEATKAAQDYYKQRKLDLSNDYANGLVDRETYNQRLQELEEDNINNQIQVARDYGQSTVDLEQQAADRRIAIAQHELSEKQKIRQTDYNHAKSIIGALMALNSLIAGQGAEATNFAKALTLVQLSIDTASAISNILAGAAKVGTSVAAASGPAGVVTGPLATAAFYATQFGAIINNFAQARELLSADTPQPTFYEGGYTTKGNPSKQASNLGQKTYIYHQNEYITPHYVLNDPLGAYHVEQLELLRLRKKKFTSNYIGFYNGGFADVPNSTQRYLAGNSSTSIDYNKLAGAMARVRPIVSVTDISAGLENKVSVEQRTNH